jgi:hypothetical protein
LIGKGAHVTIKPEDDKYGVIALGEIAEKAISADDMREWLIHSLQRDVEIEEGDERESTAAPTVRRQRRPGLGTTPNPTISLSRRLRKSSEVAPLVRTVFPLR